MRRDSLEYVEERLEASEETLEDISEEAHDEKNVTMGQLKGKNLYHNVVSESSADLHKKITKRNIDLNDCFAW